MKCILLMVITVVCGFHVFAQSSFIMTYPISQPVAHLHDYIGKTSFRGINLEFLREAKPHVDVGVEVGWNVFYEKTENKDYTKGTQTISGVQFRYTNSVPILAETRWSLKAGNHAQPYVGIGVGTLYVSRSTDFGLYRINTDTWQFCVRPEAGLMFNIQPGMKAVLGVKWYSAFNTSDLDGQSFISANIGLLFTSL